MSRADRQFWSRWWVTLSVVLAAVVCAVAMIWVSATRPLTGLEQTLFTLLLAVFGLFGTFRFGQATAKVPNARSAFRRLLGLYGGIRSVRELVLDQRDVLAQAAASGSGRVSIAQVDAVLGLVEAGLHLHAQTLDDAIADWQDIAPKEVEELVARSQAQRGGAWQAAPGTGGTNA